MAAEGQLSERRQELDLLQVDKSQAVSDRQEAIKAKTQVECLVRDLSEASTSTTSKRQALESELAGVQASIAEKEQKLSDDITPQLSTIYDQLKRLQTQLADATATSDALYAKQGRTTQFSTQQQRDNYLHNEMHALETRIHARDTKAQETRGFVKQSKANIEQLEKELRDVSSNVDGRKAALQELQDEVTLANAQSHDFGEQRKYVAILLQPPHSLKFWSEKCGRRNSG